MNREDPAPLPSPTHRNWVWRTIQILLQNVFTFWLGYRARGIEKLPPGGALLLVNHQSFLDPLLVGLPLTRPVSYLARDNLFRIPVVGWILRNTYVMPIKRESAGTESIRESVRRLEHGYYVGLFPEGTRTRDGHLGEFKPGFLIIARRANVPIIPVGIAGAFRALPRGAWWMRPVPVRVVFGDPLSEVEVQQLVEAGKETLVKTIQQRIASCLDEANSWLNEG
ncbi:MAG: 1-acyl-sn-glycerol-3-phosphate acyltransferase [Planctomycetaceae bacterium]|nr:1-acyl-sn-glycerol-3-phosphate acyltransferase [Planctomycetaceae bacterium]